VGGNNVGYHPRIWNDQNSCWGTADNLKTLVSTLHGNGVKVIADIVVNHRAGYTSWVTFPIDDFGEFGTFQLTAAHVCNDDEVNTDTNAGSEYGTATGAADTGDKWSGARDLDHTSEYVQNDIKAYLKWLKSEIGYDGWRYDLVKGFAGKYVGMYNEASEPYLSVGEYWDGSYDNVGAWIDATGKKSMAFDFPSKYAVFNNGLAQSNFGNMSWIEDNTTWRPAGMIHHANYRRYAVTFIDNHDSYRDANKYTGEISQAYAVLLASPGIPCVFFPHWNGSYKTTINKMIAFRHQAGINSESDVEVTQRSTYYESVSKGTKGTLICRIGSAAPKDAPTGYTQVAVGNNWRYFLDDECAGVESIKSDSQAATIGAVDGGVYVVNPKGEQVGVYTADGKLIESSTAIECDVKLAPGIYIVKVGALADKVLVK
ncbi:MAG: alpha-amylase family glycosyl hydrolase, partial [Muribaculaceae bacterium]